MAAFTKPPKNFPAWRLPEGIIKATEDQLDVASLSCERWAWGCGALVVVAIITELFITIAHPPYDSFFERWGSALADALIAGGIVGEVLFSMIEARYQTELRRRSDQKVADAVKAAGYANARAASLEKEAVTLRLALYQAITPRSLSRERIKALGDALLPLVPALTGKVDFAAADDTESRQYATDFMMIFGGLGIIPGGGVSFRHLPHSIQFNMIANFDVALCHTDYDGWQLSTPLFRALESVGLSVRNVALLPTPPGKVTVIIPPKRS